MKAEVARVKEAKDVEVRQLKAENEAFKVKSSTTTTSTRKRKQTSDEQE